MRHPRSFVSGFLVWLFGCLLQLYPPRFRDEFAAEIEDILRDVILDAGGYGETWLLRTSLRELTGLIISIIRECWHEFKSRKGKEMASEGQSDEDKSATISGVLALQPVRAPDLFWVASWALLTTAAFPAALFTMAPLTVAFMWLLNLGVKAGFWSAIPYSTLEPVGFIVGITLGLALLQWALLRRLLPRAWLWFIATVSGSCLYSFFAWVMLTTASLQSWHPFWIMASMLLPVGLALGLAQWLYLRRFLPGAFWIIPIDVLAAGSILLAGDTFTSLAELAILALPGAITGAGMWLLLSRLLSRSHLEMPLQVQIETSRPQHLRLPRFVRVGLGLVVLVPLVFGCIWAYAASQLTLAKSKGIYPTIEEAVITKNSQFWGGAKVVRIENVWAEPNNKNAQSHVWFGGADVYLDRVPQGGRWDHYSSGSYFIHVREGWVYVPEGAFPEFIGWVMELYNMEGVRQ
jgi:hypothetical protein